jgi:replicative DNA helicase
MRVNLEQEILGHIVADPRALEEVSEFLTMDHFDDPLHRAIYDAAARANLDCVPPKPAFIAGYVPVTAHSNPVFVQNYIKALAGARDEKADPTTLACALVCWGRAA